MLAAIILIAFSISSVIATNENEEIRQVIVCEGDQANFSCPEGKYIAIRLANYGRFTIAQCNPTHNVDLSTTCQNDKTLGILQLKCNGQNSCEFPVTNDYLGDACPKTTKYLELRYECTNVTVTTTTTTTTMSPQPTTTAMQREFTLTHTMKIVAKDTEKPPMESEGTSESMYCMAQSAREVEWPKTEASRVARMSCPIGSEGHAEWVCSPNGHWAPDGPDLSLCISTWAKSLRDDAEEAEDPIDRLETLREVQQMTRKEALLGGDLVALSTAIDASVPSKMHTHNADSFAELVIESVNNMAKESQSAAWTDLNGAKSRKVADTLMESVDRVAASVTSFGSSETTRTFIKPTIEVEISNVKVHEYVTFPSMSLYKSSYDTVDVPFEALTLRNDAAAFAKVVYVTYSSMGAHMEPESVLGLDGSTVQRRIATNVVSTSIVNSANRIQSISRLHKPVIITFRMKPGSDLVSPLCVWWNSTRLAWSPTGCSVESFNGTHTVCSCDHLTHFAVLMDVRSMELADEHNFALTFLTYAGCSLSIVCLFLSLLAFHGFGSGGGDRTWIHKNLCFSLLVAETVFLFGIWQTHDKMRCSIIAGVLHYFFLAAFMWMLLEGFELYYMLVEVFQTGSKKALFFLVGYGSPALIVGIAAYVDRYSYGTERSCWLRTENYFILWFVGPIAVILLCNGVFLMMTFCIVCRHSNVGYTPCKQDKDTIKDVRNWLKGAVALVFLLGLTWTFGLFWVDEESIAMAYAFTVLNSLQGLFIFLFHVVFNDRLHKDYRKWARRTSWLPECMRGDSQRSRPSPYIPAPHAAAHGLSSNSSTGSELLYPQSTIEKYPRMVAAIDPRYNNSVQMIPPRDTITNNGVYDYATIAYGEMQAEPSQNAYFNPVQQYPPHATLIYPLPVGSHFRPPPSFPPPPPPPAPTGIESHSSPRPHSSTLTRVSDDSAYSDGSSTFHYPNEVLSNSPGMLLRMDLTKNPPIFVQGI